MGAGSTWHRGTSQRSHLVVVHEYLDVPAYASVSIDGIPAGVVCKRIELHDLVEHPAIDQRDKVGCTSLVYSIERLTGSSTLQPWRSRAGGRLCHCRGST